MLAVPIIVLILAAILALIGARAAKQIGISERSAIVWVVCVIAFALLFVPAEWRLWLAGGLSGDRAMIIARYIGASGLLFVAGSRLKLREAWEARRLWSLVAVAVLLSTGAISIVLSSVLGFSAEEFAVLIAASAGASVWLPCGVNRDVPRVNAVSSGAAAGITGLTLVLMHLYGSVHFLVARRGPWTAYAAVAGFELAKIVMFFAASYFAASRYLGLSGTRRERPRVLIGFLLIAGLGFGLGLSLVGPLAALAWCYVAGFLFAGTKTGDRFAQSGMPAASALFLSLTFVSIALQTDSRTTSVPWLLVFAALAAVTVRFAAAWGAARRAGLRNTESLSICARLVSPGEIGPVVLWLGMTNWSVGGNAYFDVLVFTLLSMSLGQLVRRLLRSKRPVTGPAASAKEKSAFRNRGESRGRHCAGGAAVILLILSTVHSANAQAASNPADPVTRAMDQIKESVDARAADADSVLAARRLVEESNEERKGGRPQDAAASLARAISLLDQSL
ncbi:MAG: hypothetical protein ACREAC_12280, partial [Blastocatellia bacterium]